MILDLCAGPGGWDVALAWHDRYDVIGVEIDDPANATAVRAGHQRVKGDISAGDLHLLRGLPIEGIVASPPCQGFSAAGKGAGRADVPFILEAAQLLADGEDPRSVLRALDAMAADPRTSLVLEPLRWVLALDPAWTVWEQVPTVLPLWQAVAAILRAMGWYAWAGKLRAEQYGVPQTRTRAVLIASQEHPVAPPAPTHSRYYPRDPQRLDEGVEKWVSMAEALGRGMTMRPSMTLTGGGVASGGPEPFGNSGRVRMAEEMKAGRWMFGDARRANGTIRSVDEPAPTIPASMDNGNFRWMRSNYGTCGDSTNRGERREDQPAPTITSKAGRNKWVYRNGNQAHSAVRELEEPAPTIHFAARSNKVEWMDPEQAADPKASGLRVTVQEAAVLQTFPAWYGFAGTVSQQYQQVGNAVPPLLGYVATAVVLNPGVHVAQLRGNVAS